MRVKGIFLISILVVLCGIILLLKRKHPEWLFMKKAINAIKKKVAKSYNIIKGKIFSILLFFRKRLFLVNIVVFNIIIIIMWLVNIKVKEAISWYVILGMVLISIMMGIVWYLEDFWRWCDKGHGVIEKIVSIFATISFGLSPILSFRVSCSLARLYFQEKFEVIEIIVICVFLISLIMFILLYCHEIVDVNINKYLLKTKLGVFLFSVIHIIQLFADVYIILFVINPKSFDMIDVESAFSIGFDLTYFSAMTFLTGNTEITPISRGARMVVLIESFILTIYISIIVFGILMNDKNKDKIESI